MHPPISRWARTGCRWLQKIATSGAAIFTPEPGQSPARIPAAVSGLGPFIPVLVQDTFGIPLGILELAAA